MRVRFFYYIRPIYCNHTSFLAKISLLGPVIILNIFCCSKLHPYRDTLVNFLIYLSCESCAEPTSRGVLCSHVVSFRAAALVMNSRRLSRNIEKRIVLNFKLDTKKYRAQVPTEKDVDHARKIVEDLNLSVATLRHLVR